MAKSKMSACFSIVGDRFNIANVQALQQKIECNISSMELHSASGQLSYLKKETLKNGLKLSLLLDYSDFTLIPLQNLGLKGDALVEALPWQCAEFVEYSPSEGLFFHLEPTHGNLLYVYAINKDLIRQKLSKSNLELSDLSSIDVLDSALASSALNSEFKQSKIVVADIHRAFTRILYIESNRLEMIFNACPLKDEGSENELIKDLKENLQDQVNEDLEILTTGSQRQTDTLNKNKLKPAQWKFRDSKEWANEEDAEPNRYTLGCLGGALYHAC